MSAATAAITTSAFDLFRLGIGPSSSHTVGHDPETVDPELVLALDPAPETLVLHGRDPVSYMVRKDRAHRPAGRGGATCSWLAVRRARSSWVCGPSTRP